MWNLTQKLETLPDIEPFKHGPAVWWNDKTELQ